MRNGIVRRGGAAAALVVLLGVAVAAQGPEASAPRPEPAARELVVLVHGLGRSPLSMMPLEWALEEAGYEVLNWGYSSTVARLPELGEALAARVRAERLREPDRPVHWVGHSLGGILVRWVLLHHPELGHGRVVMLAPPNQGAAAADRYAPWFGWLLRPLPDLQTHDGSAVRRLHGPVPARLGVIAGAYDGKVALHETLLPDAADHLVVPAWHTFIMLQPEVHRQVVAFLRTGRFVHR